MSSLDATYTSIDRFSGYISVIDFAKLNRKCFAIPFQSIAGVRIVRKRSTSGIILEPTVENVSAKSFAVLKKQEPKAVEVLDRFMPGRVKTV